MKKILTFIFLLLFTNVFAQNDVKKTLSELLGQIPPKDYQLDHNLYKVGKIAEKHGNNEAVKYAQRSTKFKSEDEVKVLIFAKQTKGEPKKLIDIAYIESLGIKVSEKSKTQAVCYIKPDQLLAIAQKIKKEYLIVTYQEPDKEDTPQGPTLINSAMYRDNGKGGDNLTIAIWDSEWGGLQTSINGDFSKLPIRMYNNGNVASISSFTGSDDAHENHGTLCFETIYAHAPEASYELYRGDAVTAFEAMQNRGIDIISMSMSTRGYWDVYQAWEDEIPSDALVFVAAANSARGHIQTTFSEGHNPGAFHKWSGSDTYNNIINVQPNDEVRINLTWKPLLSNEGYEDYNFNLYLYRFDNNGNPIEIGSSLSNSFHESLSYTNTTGVPQTLTYRVKYINNLMNFPFNTVPPTEFEVFVRTKGSTGHDTEYEDKFSSLSNYSNSTKPNVIVVGAVGRTLYESPSGTTNIIKDYSCQGPNNSNQGTGVDIVAPTDTGVSTGSFSGTSCATPNAAGAVAAFWSAHSYLSTKGISDLIFKKAALFKDWGTTGADFVYGVGGINLSDYVANSKFLFKGSNNVTFSPSLPYYSLSQAQQNMDNNGTVLIIGDSFPQNNNIYGNTANQGLGKKLIYKLIKPMNSITTPAPAGKFGF